jgi:hypothetical protein
MCEKKLAAAHFTTWAWRLLGSDFSSKGIKKCKASKKVCETMWLKR